VQEEYSKRAAAFLQDLRSCLTLRSVLLGGGNAVFVCVNTVQTETGIQISSLSGTSNNMDADLVSLIGLHRLTFSGTVRIDG
jgi:hypothetical protein